MRKYTDRDGRDWHVDVNGATIRDVKELCGINLCEVLDDGAKLLSKLYSDQITFIDVLEGLLTEQIQQRDINGRDFAKAHGGDVLIDAMDAFQKELFDFFPNRRARETLELLTEKGKAAQELLADRAQKEIKETDLELLVENAIKSSSNSLLSQE